MGCGRSTLRQESNDIKRLAGVIESEPTKPRPHPSETGLRSLGMQVSGKSSFSIYSRLDPCGVDAKSQCLSTARNVDA